ncbi:MAG: hypothetical protein R3284_01890 [Rubricoccaceae bacterium]|nr:hypothetical protein [Rubricoccaceae bacterium]
MSDATADALSKHLLTVLPEGEVRTRADLGALPIPVAHYLRGVLNRRIARETALPQSDWVDHEAADVVAATEAWRGATRSAARFPAEAWKKSVRTAARQVISFMVEPVQTMTSFVFTDQGDEAPVGFVLERMGAFSVYPYLREITEGYFKRKNLETIGREEFERLLKSIDLRMTREYGGSDWLALLAPLFELVNTISDQDGIPSTLLKQFFTAKNQPGLADLLEASNYTNDALREALSQVQIGFESETTSEGVRPDGRESDERVADAATTVATEAKDDPKPDVEPLWKTLARDQSKKKEEDQKAQAEKVVETPESEDSSEEEPTQEEKQSEQTNAKPLWAKLSEKSEPEKSETEGGIVDVEVVDLEPEERPRESLLTLENRVLGASATEKRDWYVSSITGGSESAYRDLLQRLDEATSWDEAWPILKEAYQKNQVQIYSDPIVAFTDAVEAHFVS